MNRNRKNMTTVEEVMRNANPANRADKGKNGNGTVIFPGTQLGYDIGQMRDFVKVQKRSKGFEIQTSGGGTVDVPLKISGDGKFFLGLNIASAINATMFNHSFKLMFNEEQLFANCNGQYLCPALNPNKDMEFFPYPRPMSGSDTVILSVTSKLAEVIFVNTYYI